MSHFPADRNGNGTPSVHFRNSVIHIQQPLLKQHSLASPLYWWVQSGKRHKISNKKEHGCKSTSQREYAQGTGTPSRNKPWLAEPESCITISEVFTRAITVIIISTIRSNALSWVASLSQSREGLPTSSVWESVSSSIGEQREWRE